ncbi:MAG: hypothetical protein GX787_02765, partial [Tissierellia bacterium]|nr:hypothetical protein [Tissierellia bacterium]
MDNYIIAEVEGLYQIIKLKEFRRTKGVSFDIMDESTIPEIHAIDRVLHEGGAVSPGAVGDVERPWYMHTFQADNLLVLQGTRYVEIYTPEHGKIEKFVVTPDYVEHNGKRVFDG